MATENVRPDTFPQLLLRHSRERGERPALREKKRGIWRTVTWRELADEAAALAAALSARGLQRGAHVAFVGDNRPRLYTAMCAAHWLGAIAVPLYQDATADEMVAPVQSAEITHIFAENQEQVDKLLEILPRCPTVRSIVYDKDRGMRHYDRPELVSYDALLKQGRELAATKESELQAEAGRGSGQDAAFLFFTSGTTGAAKGVVLTHGSLMDRARVAAATESLKDTDVAMAYLPPGWIGQTFFSYVQPMVVGYCVCCPESAETMLADMREMGPTYFLATPRVLEALLTQVTMRMEDAGGFNRRLYQAGMAVAHRVGAQTSTGQTISLGDRLTTTLCNLMIYGPLRDVLGMSKVRVAFTAGDAIAPALVAFFRALGINLKQLYGSTETGFFVAMQRDGQVKPDTVGPAADGVELKFTAQREILVRSPGMFMEYHRDPETTTQARNPEGWFHTGDAGYLGDDGHLRIIDRMKYIGALNDGTAYAPKPIENRLKFSPYVKEAVTFGDRRDMVCALIDIDMAAVGRWADKRSISYTGHADLASQDEVYTLIADSIARVNADLVQEPALANSQVHRFLILHGELSADDGVLTRTGKLRRGVIAERHRTLVDAMYGGGSHVRIDVEGGQADIKIRDAKVVASGKIRSAA
ncbi:AMP-binding protein [Bradyrhizobium sp. AUGA SZCCT0222]|uniref:AMP-dependent synthetase/ligase n=1 Tax=Bradyrhizobium sp. AUGA SZCCT0222 TaxID=2807668 RepID=UPI001BA5F4B3|nr:AMP-binding protein [Bradyrhizobium sp. AUGA SZCCT0222]MBR1266007.1 AMP-binding protein [Bradyrhizobium sp. AUGA SZCCT0222]